MAAGPLRNCWIPTAYFPTLSAARTRLGHPEHFYPEIIDKETHVDEGEKHDLPLV